MSVDHDQLEALLTRVKALRRSLKAETGKAVNKLAIRAEAKALGGEWHKDFAPKIKHSLTPEALENYNTQFTHLIRISGPGNFVSSYLAAVELIIKPFNDELLIPSQQGALGTAATGSV